MNVCNVSLNMQAVARARPEQAAIVTPQGYVAGKRVYHEVTFGELEADVARIAAGLRAAGIEPGTRIAFLVPMGYDFIVLVFAALRAGIVSILIDPGMGRRNVLACLAEANPQGFIAIPLVHAVRALMRRRFPEAKHLVTVGRRWFWGGKTLAQIRELGAANPLVETTTSADDAAAIIFTTGSTGPPKGVLYQHRTFVGQVAEISGRYGIEPGEVDLPCFPLFGLFNAAMGSTAVLPDMDPTRPAHADPRKIIEAIRDRGCTQAFGSPALWNVVGRWCEQNNVKLPGMKRILSAGAPVPPHVLERMQRAIEPTGEVFTPYGATEALPVASIGAREVLAETANLTKQGKGTCVGRPFPGIDWRVIRITDEPIADIRDAETLPAGEIGELVVRGDNVTREYVTRTEANALHKIRDGETFWHRMGDVGYFDTPRPGDVPRFWFCGRKGHRVITSAGTMFTIPCEAIFNNHPAVYRSALVGVGPRGSQRPVVIVEPWPEKFPRGAARARLMEELLALAAGDPLTKDIRDVFVMKSLPVDIRHNSKIFREKLAVWAAKRVR